VLFLHLFLHKVAFDKVSFFVTTVKSTFNVVWNLLQRQFALTTCILLLLPLSLHCGHSSRTRYGSDLRYHTVLGLSLGYGHSYFVLSKAWCYLIVLLSVGIHTDKCVISGLLSVWIRTAVCASVYHTVHTLALTLSRILTLSLTLNPTLTLNLTLISSYLTNEHQYPQHNMSANWMMWRLRDQSTARFKNCQLVPIGCTDNTVSACYRQGPL